MFRASTGGMAFGPRGLPHAFQNIGEALGRLLVITTPSGLERFFEQSAELPRPVDPEEMAAIGRANWMEFSGPPLEIPILSRAYRPTGCQHNRAPICPAPRDGHAEIRMLPRKATGAQPHGHPRMAEPHSATPWHASGVDGQRSMTLSSHDVTGQPKTIIGAQHGKD